jgi:hypothetical protein
LFFIVSGSGGGISRTRRISVRSFEARAHVGFVRCIAVLQQLLLVGLATFGALIMLTRGINEVTIRGVDSRSTTSRMMAPIEETDILIVSFVETGVTSTEQKMGRI